MPVSSRSVSLNRERLLECRKRVGLSQAKAAKNIGLSAPAMCKAEGGQPIDTETARRIADYYGVTVPYLEGVEDAQSERVQVMLAIADLLDVIRGELQGFILNYPQEFERCRANHRSDEAARDHLFHQCRARIDEKARSSRFVHSIVVHFPEVATQFRDADNDAKRMFAKLQEDVHRAANDKFNKGALSGLLERIGEVLEPLKGVRDKLHDIHTADTSTPARRPKRPR